jgi:hypothetical protein
MLNQSAIHLVIFEERMLYRVFFILTLCLHLGLSPSWAALYDPEAPPTLGPVQRCMRLLWESYPSNQGLQELAAFHAQMDNWPQRYPERYSLKDYYQGEDQGLSQFDQAEDGIYYLNTPQSRWPHILGRWAGNFYQGFKRIQCLREPCKKIFAMNGQGIILTGKNVRRSIYHSSLFAGGILSAVGNLWFTKQGTLLIIDDFSGHYSPTDGLSNITILDEILRRKWPIPEELRFFEGRRFTENMWGNWYYHFVFQHFQLKKFISLYTGSPAMRSTIMSWPHAQEVLEVLKRHKIIHERFIGIFGTATPHGPPNASP